MVFYGCTGLTTVDLPEATYIGSYAFQNTGTTPLAITLPKAAPSLSSIGYSFNDYSKMVTVKTPADRTGYDASWQHNFKVFFSHADVTLAIEKITP
jgi:hypothetical protein